MSYIAIPDPVIFSKSLSNGSKILYGVIKRYVDIGQCFATNSHFADILNCSESNIKRYLKELLSQGYITSKVNRKNNKITSRILSISGSIEVGSNMILPTSEGRVKYEPKVGANMSQVITEVNNRNKKINKKENFAKQIRSIWNEKVVECDLKKKSNGLGVTTTDINNIQKIIKFAKDEGSTMDYSKIDTWRNYFSELFRICANKDFLQNCIKTFSWSVKPNTYQKLADDTYFNLGEVN